MTKIYLTQEAETPENKETIKRILNNLNLSEAEIIPVVSQEEYKQSKFRLTPNIRGKIKSVLQNYKDGDFLFRFGNQDIYYYACNAALSVCEEITTIKPIDRALPYKDFFVTFSREEFGF
ncbi:hypothetical protein ACFX5K_03705 [Rickettsiales bacterium LUAb2]